MTTKDLIWIAGILIAMGSTWGMTSQRVTAMERDMDRIEQALIMFTKMIQITRSILLPKVI